MLSQFSVRLHASRLILVLLLAAVGAIDVRARPTNDNTTTSVEVQMRNVMYHFTDRISVHIRMLHGRLIPVAHDLPIFDDKNSFVVAIDSAEMSMSAASLANVLNSYVFATSDAPLKDIAINVVNGTLKIKGKLHSRGDVPFETEGRLTATPDGKIRLHAEHIKALHVPVKGLMDLIGVEVSKLVKTDKVRGVRIDGDDFILDPTSILPPPHIQGSVSAVRVENNEVFQTFGSKHTSPIQIQASNYMAYRGNRLRFGKLTMSDTDMVLIDMDANDPFDFYLDHYKEQLVAGYTKETPSFGLRVFMRDYNKLRHDSGSGRTRAARVK